MKTSTCKNCSEEFRNNPNKKCKNIFCSRKCYFEWKESEKRKNKAKARIMQIIQSMLRRCDQCGDVVYSNKKKYCSDDCIRAANRVESTVCRACGRESCRWATYCDECRAAKGQESKKRNKKRQSGTENHRRRARKYGVRYQPVSFRRLRLVRPHTKCIYCEREMIFNNKEYNPLNATIEHIKPMADGGEHVIDNLTICCSQCNSIKGDRTIAYLRQHDQYQQYASGGKKISTAC